MNSDSVDIAFGEKVADPWIIKEWYKIYSPLPESPTRKGGDRWRIKPSEAGPTGVGGRKRAQKDTSIEKMNMAFRPKVSSASWSVFQKQRISYKSQSIILNYICEIL